MGVAVNKNRQKYVPFAAYLLVGGACEENKTCELSVQDAAILTWAIPK